MALVLGVLGTTFWQSSARDYFIAHAVLLLKSIDQPSQVGTEFAQTEFQSIRAAGHAQT